MCVLKQWQPYHSHNVAARDFKAQTDFRDVKILRERWEMFCLEKSLEAGGCERF